MARLAQTPTGDTRTRVLDAAERRFGSQGIHGTSIREIAGDAKANLAAVNYHFGSKEALYEAVFVRRIRPLNDARLKGLAEVLATGQAKDLRSIVRTFIHPTLEMGRDHPSFLAVLGRNLTTPPPFMTAVAAREFEPILRAYRPALHAALPALSATEIFWRMHFVVGSLLYSVAHFSTIEQLSDGLCRTDAIDQTSERLVNFAYAGLADPRVPERRPLKRSSP